MVSSSFRIDSTLSLLHKMKSFSFNVASSGYDISGNLMEIDFLRNSWYPEESEPVCFRDVKSKLPSRSLWLSAEFRTDLGIFNTVDIVDVNAGGHNVNYLNNSVILVLMMNIIDNNTVDGQLWRLSFWKMHDHDHDADKIDLACETWVCDASERRNGTERYSR